MKKRLLLLCIVTAMSVFVCVGKKPRTTELYAWEKGRDKLPAVADIVLCYGGSEHRAKHTAPWNGMWPKERFAPMVSYVDQDSKEHWLFECFLGIEFSNLKADKKQSVDYMLGMGRPSAEKSDWIHLMDYWFQRGNGFDALDQAVEDAKARLGEPKSKRFVMVTLPDAIIHKQWDDLSTPTAYWGELNGKSLDFSKKEDRLTALKWYINEVRARFAAQNYRNIELIGFYVISEDLSVTVDGKSYGWDPHGKYKANLEIYPEISRYIHSLNEGIYWIPYNHSGGHQFWNSIYEMDIAIMQPNYFWPPKSGNEIDWSKFYDTIAKYNMGMEIEFDDAILGSSDKALMHKERLRTYLESAKTTGVWGTKPFGVYQDNDTFYRLSVSHDESDQQIFHEFCRFILDNPIKKY